MSLSLLRGRAARTAQAEAAVQDQTEKAIPSSSRAERITRLEQVLAPGEETRSREEREVATAAEKTIVDLENEKKRVLAQAPADGRRAILDDFASRRREIEFNRDQALEAAEHHARAAKAHWEELRRLRAEEEREVLSRQVAAAKAKGESAIGAARAASGALTAALIEARAVDRELFRLEKLLAPPLPVDPRYGVPGPDTRQPDRHFENGVQECVHVVRIG